MSVCRTKLDVCKVQKIAYRIKYRHDCLFPRVPPAARRAIARIALRHSDRSGQPVRLQPRSASDIPAMAPASAEDGHSPRARVKAPTFLKKTGGRTNFTASPGLNPSDR